MDLCFFLKVEVFFTRLPLALTSETGGISPTVNSHDVSKTFKLRLVCVHYCLRYERKIFISNDDC